MNIYNYKELLEHLLHKHNILVTLHVLSYNKPKQIIVVNLRQVINSFFDNMVFNWDGEPITFTDIHHNKHEFNTTNQNKIRHVFIQSYQIKGDFINTKVRGYKQLLQKFEETHNVIVSFKIQRINKRPLDTKRNPDSFLYYKSYLKDIHQQYNSDMFFDYSTNRKFSFKRMNGSPYRLERHRIRKYETISITIVEKQEVSTT